VADAIGNLALEQMDGDVGAAFEAFMRKAQGCSTRRPSRGRDPLSLDIPEGRYMGERLKDLEAEREQRPRAVKPLPVDATDEQRAEDVSARLAGAKASRGRARRGNELMPTVALSPLWTPLGWPFLVRAMTNVALNLHWAGRGLAATVTYDANDLALAAAGAGIDGGAPLDDDRFRPCTAALAEDCGNGRHERPASDSHAPPPGCTCPERATWCRKAGGSRDEFCANVCAHRSERAT
jgi:hypothetical protein